MKHEVVPTSNVIKAVTMMEDLRSASAGEEKMGLIHGDPGLGKTTAVTHLTQRTNGVFLRARVSWTVRSMLQSIQRELGQEPGHFSDPMVEEVVQSLALDPRPLIIDEADYLLRQIDMLDALRDIYDTAQVPVVLVMMKEAPRKIRSKSRLSRFKRRITQWVEFEPISLEDVERTAETMAEVEVQGGLLERIHEDTAGNMGKVVIALARVEEFAKTNDLTKVGLSEYGERPLDQSA